MLKEKGKIIMKNGNLYISKNNIKNDNCCIAKKSSDRMGNDGSATFVFFVGSAVLKTSAEKEFVSVYDFQRTANISHADFGKSYSVSLDGNRTIDLMKIVNLNKIRKMALFSENWNGTGGSVFSERAICLFESIIHMLIKQPQIAPTGRNSLLLQYEMDDKSLLAFEVSEKKVEKVYIPQGDYSLVQTEEFSDCIARHIEECVEDFYGFK